MTRFGGQSEEAGWQERQNPMSTEARKTHQRYEEAFKRSAVEHWLSSGKKAAQIASELGVSVWNLRDWKKRYGPAPGPAKTMAQLEAENRALRQELLRAIQPSSAIVHRPVRQRQRSTASWRASATTVGCHSRKRQTASTSRQRTRPLPIRSMEPTRRLPPELCSPGQQPV